MCGMDKVVAFDQSHSLDDFMALPSAKGGMARSERSQLVAMSLI
jgi:hypothetical protein